MNFLIKLLSKDTLNSKIVPMCEFKPCLVYAERKNVTIEEKTSQKFSWANSVIINIFLFYFIKCRSDKKHVHIDSLNLIRY